jgi:hypothetical protein
MTATDNVGISSCQLYVNGTLSGSMSASGSLYTRQHTFTIAGTYSAYARCQDAAGNATNSATASFTLLSAPASVSATLSGIQMAPINIAANGTSYGVVTVTARDSAGNPLSGKTVSVRSSRGDQDLYQSIQTTTDAFGQAVFHVRSYQIGNGVMLAWIDGLQITPTVNYMFVSASTATPNPGSLIKLVCPDGAASDHPCKAVYYVGTDGKRHAFPNDKAYFTWFSDFSSVQEVSASTMSAYALGRNVTYRPGTRMVKFQTVPTVYAVARGGVLRPIASEAVAIAIYGPLWNRQIDDLSEAFYTNYTFGGAVNSSSDFIGNAAFVASSIDASL